jgi:hypothetical protein
MSTLTIELDDSVNDLIQRAAAAANLPVEEWVRVSISRAAGASGAHQGSRRVSPLHPDMMRPAEDFNAPLEDFANHV